MPPRYCSVTISIAGSSGSIDVTSDLISFLYEETMGGNLGSNTMELTLDDASNLYRSTWFVAKGTQITATMTTHNWFADGDSFSKGTGIMWVDEVEMELKPATIIIKANSISPDLLREGQQHTGTEGQSVTDQIKDTASKHGLPSMDGSSGKVNPSNENMGGSVPSSSSGSVTTSGSGINNATPGGNNINAVPSSPTPGPSTINDPPVQRLDQDNESALKAAQKWAKEHGMNVMVIDGKIIYYKETDIEAKAPYKTITDGVTPIIRGRFKTTCVGMFKNSKASHFDPKTGKLTSATFEPTEPPSGTKATLNIRTRPHYTGTSTSPYHDPETSIGENSPGTVPSGKTDYTKYYVPGEGYDQNGNPIEQGSPNTGNENGD